MIIVPKSSQKSGRQILGVIPVARAERMLVEWANTGAGEAAWRRLFRCYPEIPANGIEADFDRLMEMATGVSLCLRKAWDAASNLRAFDWYTWHAQRMYEVETAFIKRSVASPHLEDRTKILQFVDAAFETADPPPVATPVEAAIFYLRQHRDRALHCPNPECPAPYFFQKKKSQKFCSPECAKPSQRESKRRWWRANRAKRRTP